LKTTFVYAKKEYSVPGILLHKALPVFCMSIAIIYLAKAYLAWSWLGVILSIVCVLSVIISLPFVKGNTRVVALALFAAGVILFFSSEAEAGLWLSAVAKNANLVTLLVLVPIFGLPLEHGGYYKVLDALVDRFMNNNHRMFWVPALLGHFFGALMNMGALPIVYQLIMHGNRSSAFRAVPAAIVRGFCSSIYWSPNMVSVALVISYLALPWAIFARGGLIFTLLSLVVGWVIHIVFNRKNTPYSGKDKPKSTLNAKKLLELVIFCSLFLGVIVIIAVETTVPVFNVVPLLALVYPVLWLGLLGKGKVIYSAYRSYVTTALPGYASEIVMFLGAGFLASALLHSGSGEKISLLFGQLAGLSPCLLCFLLAFSIVLMSLVGIMPMVTVTAYCASLQPALLGLSTEQLSLVLVGGWATSVLASPFTGITLIMSGLMRKSSLSVARSNWLYAAVMLALISAVPLLS